MVTFRIIHASDLHFSVRPDVVNPIIGVAGLRAPNIALWWRYRDTATLFGSASFSSPLATHFSVYIESIQDGLDALVLTGDLATTGEDADLRAAREYIFRGSELGRKSLSIPLSLPVPKELPIILLPGNHDRFQGRTCLPGGKSFERVFGESWDANQGITIEQREAVRAVVLEKDNEHLAICSADFSLKAKGHSKGNGGWLGQGRAYEDVLDSIVELTHDIRARYENVCVVWAIHFPPERSQEPDKQRLVDGHLIAPRARECGVNCILCGHVHLASVYEIAPQPFVRIFCAGSVASMQTGSEHAIYDLEFAALAGQLQSITGTKITFDVRRDAFHPERRATYR